MHLLAERHILAGLKEGGWLQGEVDDMLEQRIAALFMPHGCATLLPSFTCTQSAVLTAAACITHTWRATQQSTFPPKCIPRIRTMGSGPSNHSPLVHASQMYLPAAGVWFIMPQQSLLHLQAGMYVPQHCAFWFKQSLSLLKARQCSSVCTSTICIASACNSTVLTFPAVTPLS